MTGELLAAGGGFLLAVLWFDLMFDVQALRGPRGAPLPEATLASIAAYYRRVTQDAHPMGRLVGVVMGVTILAALADLFRGDASLGVRLASLALLAVPVALALTRVFPSAARLAARTDTTEEQSRLARAIARDHLLCLAAIAAFLAMQLGG
jgi:hypothetical protein